MKERGEVSERERERLILFIFILADPYEAEQMLKDVDVHSVTGILKSYLRELPEALFTDLHYPKFVETFNKFSSFSETHRIKALQEIARELPVQNQATINHILDHLIR